MRKMETEREIVSRHHPGLTCHHCSRHGLKGGHRQISVLVLQVLEEGFPFAEGNSRDGCGMRDKMRYFLDSVLFFITLWFFCGLEQPCHISLKIWFACLNVIWNLKRTKEKSFPKTQDLEDDSPWEEVHRAEVWVCWSRLPCCAAHCPHSATCSPDLCSSLHYSCTPWNLKSIPSPCKAPGANWVLRWELTGCWCMKAVNPALYTRYNPWFPNGVSIWTVPFEKNPLERAQSSLGPSLLMDLLSVRYASSFGRTAGRSWLTALSILELVLFPP